MSKSVTTPAKAQSHGALLRPVRDMFWFAALAGVLLIFLHESLFLGKGLVPADAILKWPPWNQANRLSNFVLSDQYLVFLPIQEFVHQHKGLPLWNPGICCGAPNLGSIQGALLFPIRLLLTPLDPFYASGLAAFLKLCLAGWFTMLYVRLLGVSRPAAFMAGLVFSLSGFMIVWLGHPHVNCAMWLPLLLYFLEKSFRQSEGNAFAATDLRTWCGFAVAFAFMILGGHPPTCIHSMIVLAIYFLFRLMEHRHGQKLQRAGLLAGAIAIGLLLAAPQIVPFLEYYRHSSSAQASALLAQWSLHLNFPSLIHFLLPNALDNPVLGFADLPKLLGWHEAHNFSEKTGYVGILPLFLAACAIALRPCKFTLFFFSLAIGSMLVICGVPPLPALMRALPIIRYMNQMRLLLVVGFCVAVLAGFGWDELFSRTRSQRRTIIVTIGFCALAGLALLCFCRVTGPAILALDGSHWDFLRRQFLIVVGGMLIAVVLALWPAHWNVRLPMVVCLGWTAVDLLCFGTGYNPFIPRALYYPRTPAIEWLQKDDSLFRIFGEARVFPGNSPEVFGLSDARGIDYMTVQRYEELITGEAGNFFFYGNSEMIPPVFPLLNVKYLLSPKALIVNPLLFELVYSKEIFIYGYKECLDRAFPVFDYEVEPDRAAALARVSSAEFDPRRTLLLEEQPVLAKSSAGNRTVGTNAGQSVRIISYEPDDVRIEASLPRPGFLLLLDTYFPGWSAAVNCEPAQILRADYNFRAVSLPAGRSTVSFFYRPASFRIGLCLCAAGILVLAAGLFLPWKRKPGGTIPGGN